MSNKLPNFNKKSRQPCETGHPPPAMILGPGCKWNTFFFAAGVLLKYCGEINQKTNPQKTCKKPVLRWKISISSMAYQYDTCLPVRRLVLESFLSVSHNTVGSKEVSDPMLHVRYLVLKQTSSSLQTLAHIFTSSWM